MSFAGVCIVCLFATLTVTLFKQYSPTFAVVIAFVTAVALMILCLAFLHPVLETLEDKFQSIESYSQYFSGIIKCIGICYLSDFTYKLCEENNGRSMAYLVSVFAKISVVYICLPFLADTLDYIEKLMNL